MKNRIETANVAPLQCFSPRRLSEYITSGLVQHVLPLPVSDLPDDAVVAAVGAARAVVGGRLRRWTENGYGASLTYPSLMDW